MDLRVLPERLSVCRLPVDDPFARGLAHAARYWIATEIPRVAQLAALASGPDRSYLDARPDEL